MNEPRWLLYGANGYTGTLIAREAVRRGLRPVLAGRNASAVGALAAQLGLESRVFGLDDPRAVVRGLEGCVAVLHAAGPFSQTSRPVLDACLEAKAHYLDVTGEIDVFEACHARDAEARARGVVVLPGVGFDVVPTDCLAATLKRRMPDATSLELAFATNGPVGPGSVKTMLEALPTGGAIRRDGKIVHVPQFWRTREVPFDDRTRHSVSIPWGDVSTAYHSTGIGNIVVYLGVPAAASFALPLLRTTAPLLGRPAVQKRLARLVDRFVPQPKLREGHDDRCHLWGRVTNVGGEALEATLTTPGTYPLTACTAIESVERVISGNVTPGATTPSRAFGESYITQFEGCELRSLPSRG